MSVWRCVVCSQFVQDTEDCGSEPLTHTHTHTHTHTLSFSQHAVLVMCEHVCYWVEVMIFPLCVYFCVSCYKRSKINVVIVSDQWRRVINPAVHIDGPPASGCSWEVSCSSLRNSDHSFTHLTSPSKEGPEPEPESGSGSWSSLFMKPPSLY